MKYTVVEIPKEEICCRRIPLEDFPIFSNLEPLNYVTSCDFASVAPTASEPSKNKIKSDHKEVFPKRAKVVEKALEASSEEPKHVVASSYARNVVPSDTRPLIVVNSSSSLPTINSLDILYVLKPIPTSAPLTINPNITIPPPSSSLSKLLPYTIIPPFQSPLPSLLLSQLILPENHPLDLEPSSH